MPTLQIMRLRAIMFDKIQRFHRHTFTSHTAMRQSVLVLHPSRRTTDQNNCPQPHYSTHYPPQPQKAHTSYMPTYEWKQGDRSRVIISSSKWLKKQ